LLIVRAVENYASDIWVRKPLGAAVKQQDLSLRKSRAIPED